MAKYTEEEKAKRKAWRKAKKAKKEAKKQSAIQAAATAAANAAAAEAMRLAHNKLAQQQWINPETGNVYTNEDSLRRLARMRESWRHGLSAKQQKYIGGKRISKQPLTEADLVMMRVAGEAADRAWVESYRLNTPEKLQLVFGDEWEEYNE